MSSSGNRTRLNQRLRTRRALLDAARALVARGAEPTVTEVADAAGVSRATAYRYFPTQEELLVEATLDADAPAAASLLGDGAPADPEDRAALVQNVLYDLARDHEAEFRIFLSGSVRRAIRNGRRQSDPLRGARRAALLDAALAPLRDELPAEEVERLATGVAMLVGVESMIVLRDVLHLGHDEARRAGEWAVRRLVRAARAGPA